MTTAKVLLDTNIVSYLMKGRPEARVYAPHLQGKLAAIAFITVGELFYGAEKRGWGEQRRLKLETVLRNFVVVPYNYEVAKAYARVLVEREGLGRPISSNDAWITACALRHDVPLVTHNFKDFDGISSLKIISES
jgi:tRNA(fMet)-specific endonuclease VapC